MAAFFRKCHASNLEASVTLFLIIYFQGLKNVPSPGSYVSYIGKYFPCWSVKLFDDSKYCKTMKSRDIW